MKFSKLYRAVILLPLVLVGCGSMLDSSGFVHSGADFSFYKKVGVLTFKSQGTDQLAGDKVTEHFITAMLIQGKLEVMDPGQFSSVVAQVAQSRAPVATLELTPAQLTQIAEVAGVQGIFMGTIHDYEMIQLGGEKYPMISMTIKLIDAPTGTIAWQESVTALGGPNLPIVSIGETYTFGQLTQKVCRSVTKDFFKMAYSK